MTQPTTFLLAGLCALLAACAAAAGSGRDPHPPRRLLAAGEGPGAVPLAGPTWLAPCTPTPVPVPSPDYPGFGGPVIVSGIVHDPTGQPADGAIVVARSLDASVPYSATATTVQGSWVINNVPEGARMRLVAIGTGWVTPRYELEAARQRTGRRNLLDLRAEPVFALPEASASPPPRGVRLLAPPT